MWCKYFLMKASRAVYDHPFSIHYLHIIKQTNANWMHVSKHEKLLILLQFSSPQNLPDLGFCQENGTKLPKRRIKRDAHFWKSHKLHAGTRALLLPRRPSPLCGNQTDKRTSFLKLRDKQSIAHATVGAALLFTHTKIVASCSQKTAEVGGIC